MRVKAKYPMRIGTTMIGQGEVGETVPMTQRIESSFPGIVHNPNSTILLVKFPNVDECLISQSQVTIEPEVTNEK